MNKMTVLSTKKLSRSQEELLLNAGIMLESYDAIQITPLDFKAPEFIKNAIFTSQNGVDSFFKNKDSATVIERCFCVGEKTGVKLKENGQKVVKTTENAVKLAHFIIKNYENDSFSFVCGSRRRNDIPDLLKEEKIPVFELKTYKTELKPRYFNKKWSKIMFFSPSGVESFVNGQKEGKTTSEMEPEYFSNTTAICIGETTATAAKKYISNVIVANSTTVESVIATTLKTIANDKN